MIKTLLYIALSTFLITGCTSTPPQKASDIGILGLLLCQKNEICPIVTVAWNESNKTILKVKMSLNSSYKKYEINKVVFTNGKTSHSFNVDGPTEIDFVFGSYRSRNSIMLPVKFMADFTESKEVSMNIYTDQGVISRYILKDEIKAPVFEELNKVYKSSI